MTISMYQASVPLFRTLLGALSGVLDKGVAFAEQKKFDPSALVNARLLKPLGNPAQNSTKYFATEDLLETAKDRAWLVKMTTAINTHWQKQNAKKGRSVNGSQNGPLRQVSLSYVENRV